MHRIFFLVLLMMLILPATAPAGCIRGNCQNGNGTMTFADGRLYQGQFVNGRFNGHATYTLSKRIRYVGEFRNGEFHGQGTYIFEGVLEYSGQFVDNVPQGQGLLSLADGRSFTGTFVKGAVAGQGVLTLPDGRIFAGTFDDSVMEGPISEAMLADARLLGVAGKDGTLVKAQTTTSETQGLGYTPAVQ